MAENIKKIIPVSDVLKFSQNCSAKFIKLVICIKANKFTAHS